MDISCYPQVGGVSRDAQQRVELRRRISPSPPDFQNVPLASQERAQGDTSSDAF
jgi:hypothetical protein